MTRQLVLAFFPDLVSAEATASVLKESGVASHDAIGVLAIDPAGNLIEDKVGASSVAAGAGIGAALLILGPAMLGFGAAAAVVGGGVGVAGGAVGGSLHHKGLKLSDEDKARISGELSAGNAAVGVLAEADEAAAVQDKLTELGGAPTAHEVVDEQALAAAVTD